MSANARSLKVYRNAALALYALLAATVLVAKINLGPLALAIALAIAGAKATIVGLFFMHLSRASGVTKLFAASGLFWFAVLLGLTVADYLHRI